MIVGIFTIVDIVDIADTVDIVGTVDIAFIGGIGGLLKKIFLPGFGPSSTSSTRFRVSAPTLLLRRRTNRPRDGRKFERNVRKV